MSLLGQGRRLRPGAKGIWQTWAFSAPAAPVTALTLPPIIYLPPYFNESLGLELSLVGAAFFLARMLDVLIDPILGDWQDRTRSILGRRRLWLLAVTPILMLAIWAAFIGLKPGAPFALIVALIFVIQSGVAAMFIALGGWAAELRPDYHGRTRLLGAFQAMGVVGQILILLLPAVIQLAGLGDFAAGVHAMGWGLIVSLPLGVLVCALNVPEPPRPPERSAGWRDSWQALRNLPDLRRVLIAEYLVGISQGLTGGLFVMLFRHVLEMGDFSEALLLLYFVASLVGVPLWVRIADRLGKKRAAQLGLAWIAVLFLLLPLIPPDWKAVILIGVVISGLGQSASILLFRSMLADLVDEDAVRGGRARAGLFFGLQTMLVKLGIATGPLAFIALDAFGFQAELGADNSAMAKAALVGAFALGPLLVLGLAIWVLRNYSLSEARHRQLREILDHAEAAGPA